MARKRWLVVALCSALCALGGESLGVEVDLPRNPSISPDGSELCFSWRGDLWTGPAAGGRAVRLTAHPSSDLRSAWSPDGKTIAFNSRRDGALNVWLIGRDGSGLRQLTQGDQGVVLGQFSPGGLTLGVSGRIEGDVYKASRPYLVGLGGGPLRRVHDAFGHDAVVSPDGRWVAFVRGESSWSRRSYRGPDSRDLWLYDLRDASFRQLTTWSGNDGMPHWAGPRELLFVSDRLHDRANVFRLQLSEDGKSQQAPLALTSFKDRDVADLDVGGGRAVCVAWDALYTLDLSGAAGPRRVRFEASGDGLDPLRLQPVDREVSEAVLSPDGKTLAVIAYGEVFVRAVGKLEPTRRVTTTSAREQGLAWSPDGTRLYFASDLDGTSSIYAAEVILTGSEVEERYRASLAPVSSADTAPVGSSSQGAEAAAEEPAEEEPAEEPAPKTGKKKGKKTKKSKPEGPGPGERWADALRFSVAPLILGPSEDSQPSPSPDGRYLAFRRGVGELWLWDFEAGEARRFLKGWDASLHWQWSPDGRWLAYSQQNRNFNSEVWIAPLDGSREPVNVSMHPDDDYDPVWAADGKSLAFVSHREGSADIYLLYLERALEDMSSKDLREHYAAAGKVVKGRKPLAEGARAELPALELDLERAYLRLRRVTDWPGDEQGLVIAPDGEYLAFSGSQGGEPGLFRVRYDGKKVKQLSGPGRLVGSDLSGSNLVAIAAQRAVLIPSGGGKVEAQAVSATLEIEEGALASQKFREAARILGARFYHPTMKGLNWRALSERYHSLAVRTRTPDEFYEVASRFVGELNASHLGIYPPWERPARREASGYLGIDVLPQPGGFRVEAVLAGGPADQDGMRLEPGDVISEVERRGIEPSDTLPGLLRGRVGEDTLLTVRRQLPGRAQPTELLVRLRPTTFRTVRTLRYRAWTEERRELVERWSKGRIGYLHIRGMNQPSLVEFERDLYAAGYGKEGLLIDVRNNGGGWTADRVLASLTTRPHAYTVPRGATPSDVSGYPQGRLFIQRFTGPSNLLCNEKSFSNAEILSHAFKTLGRGTLVGEQTYGGVISTGATTLVDGTRVRLPFRGWYLPDGTDMENNGAIPDLRVPQTPLDEAAGFDRQLQTATQDLLERLPPADR